MTDDRSRAFSLGSDARIAGQPMTANPYPVAEKAIRKAWQEGWWDVHHFWNAWAQWQKYPTRELPASGTGRAARVAN